MLNENKPIKEIFEIKFKDIKLRAEISAELGEIWIILDDLIPERLKAYGKLSVSEKTLIEPPVLSLLNKLDELHRLLK